jgi:hypothetical protein
MIDCNLIIKNHIHGLVTKLWSNNEQGILQIVTMQFIGTLKP